MTPATAGPPASGCVLGLDLGEARIGIAVSDPDRRLALPVGTVRVGQPPGELLRIAELVREHNAGLVVLGLPLSMSGAAGPAAQKAEAFARALGSSLEVPVVLQDERLSTVQAERNLGEAGVKGHARRQVVDAVAAQVLLQAWLDTHR